MNNSLLNRTHRKSDAEKQQTHSELEQMTSTSFKEKVLKSAELTEKGHEARVAQQFAMI